ncbi:hypothetical protein L3Y34_011033 [Caenorhabditis briggsae]|uniref:Uncharacterized protein n=1 Tax=Caenorhabditis briggsae TaxID=6238 RepID=A0AAE8ZKW7_CAEBR|nr:hypothetical protein L3Y34_011033 [Caenorhabditis briggsae]
MDLEHEEEEVMFGEASTSERTSDDMETPAANNLNPHDDGQAEPSNFVSGENVEAIREREQIPQGLVEREEEECQKIDSDATELIQSYVGMLEETSGGSENGSGEVNQDQGVRDAPEAAFSLARTLNSEATKVSRNSEANQNEVTGDVPEEALDRGNVDENHQSSFGSEHVHLEVDVDGHDDEEEEDISQEAVISPPAPQQPQPSTHEDQCLPSTSSSTSSTHQQIPSGQPTAAPQQPLHVPDTPTEIIRALPQYTNNVGQLILQEMTARLLEDTPLADTEELENLWSIADLRKQGYPAPHYFLEREPYDQLPMSKDDLERAEEFYEVVLSAVHPKLIRRQSSVLTSSTSATNGVQEEVEQEEGEHLPEHEMVAEDINDHDDEDQAGPSEQARDSLEALNTHNGYDDQQEVEIDVREGEQSAEDPGSPEFQSKWKEAMAHYENCTIYKDPMFNKLKNLFDPKKPEELPQKVAMRAVSASDLFNAFKKAYHFRKVGEPWKLQRRSGTEGRSNCSPSF